MGLSGRQGHYGIDAPYAPMFMLAGAVACVGLAVFAHIRPFWFSAAFLFVMASVYLHTTLRGKFTAWRKLLDDLSLEGGERLLDLGCGRGAVLLMAAERLPRGRAVGIDIWSTHDQSGNAMEVTLANAAAEGVDERVELQTADMRELPFEDGSFDVIVSNVAIHNIADEAGRDKAIAEAWRVLRPGGRLLIADISHSKRYLERLVALGAQAHRRSLGWRMWWGAPWMPTMLVDARKRPEV